jgi:acyl carrier protein
MTPQTAANRSNRIEKRMDTESFQKLPQSHSAIQTLSPALHHIRAGPVTGNLLTAPGATVYTRPTLPGSLTRCAVEFYRREVNAMAIDEATAGQIRSIIAERLDRKLEEITDEASFVDDLGADSLDLTELLMALEEEFNIEIDDEANAIETVGDAIKYIGGKL